jgi:hypothetical protein
MDDKEPKENAAQADEKSARPATQDVPIRVEQLTLSRPEHLPFLGWAKVVIGELTVNYLPIYRDDLNGVVHVGAPTFYGTEHVYPLVSLSESLRARIEREIETYLRGFDLLPKPNFSPNSSVGVN